MALVPVSAIATSALAVALLIGWRDIDTPADLVAAAVAVVWVAALVAVSHGSWTQRGDLSGRIAQRCHTSD